MRGDKTGQDLGILSSGLIVCRLILKVAGATATHPMALALDLGTGDVRGAAAGPTPTNTGIAGFLELFHFFPLQPELVATAHIIPTGQAHTECQRCYSRLPCYPVLKVN